jgi:hypothetical protein
VHVFAVNQYRFIKPGASLLTPPAEKIGDATQTIAQQLELGQAFFELQAGKFQDAPDWIQEDGMFKMALKDGDIKIVAAGSPEEVANAETTEAVAESGEPTITRSHHKRR